MAEKSFTFVVPLSAAACFVLIRQVGQKKGYVEKESDGEGIDWIAENCNLGTWVTPQSENKTEVKIIASSDAIFDFSGKLDQLVKLFALSILKEKNSDIKFASIPDQKAQTGINKPVKRQPAAPQKVTKESAQRNMLFGALWCIGGILMTAWGYSSVSRGGGTYFIFWGAIIFGGIQFFQGLMQYSSAPDSMPDYTNDYPKIEQNNQLQPDSTDSGFDKTQARDKLGAYVSDLSEVNDEKINKILKNFQNPMAYIREAALNQVSDENMDDPRLIGAIEILAASDHVETIRDIAKRTLSKLEKTPTP